MKQFPKEPSTEEQSTVAVPEPPPEVQATAVPEAPKQPQFIPQTNRHPEQGMLVHRDEATKKLVDAETKNEIIEKKEK